jgi:biopolymer transport protein ExbB
LSRNLHAFLSSLWVDARENGEDCAQGPISESSMQRRRLTWILLLIALPAVALAASWWNGDWKYRKEIVFDMSPSGADVAGTAQDVPVLLRLSLANFNYFNDVKPDGSDFRAIGSDDKTPLKFHIERIDAQNQLAYIWVAMPRITGGSKSDKMFLYYGNPSAAAAGDTPGTFDVNQALELEFDQTSGLPLDATAYKNNPTASTAELVPASLIAGGVKFSGAQSITVPASASLRLLPNRGLTLSGWVKPSGPQQSYFLALSEAGHELVLGINGTRAFARYSGDGPPVVVAQTGSELSNGDWHHLALTAGAGQLNLFIDGIAANQQAVNLQEIGGTLTVGASASAGQFLSGEVDQVGVANSVRSADWIKAEARNEGTTANLVLYGADGQKEGGQSSYFVTIAKNLTVDGWVIIIICITMLIIALGIMVLKALYLGRVERANERFLENYHGLSPGGNAGAPQSELPEQSAVADRAPAMAALARSEDKFSASTLFALFQMGMAELSKRMSGRAAGADVAMVLSPQSIEAIRASMDATQTRLQQRLASQMVLLTIAISGGPFLGLLGTVIGVMITFAAIALSGDVNINAIAPGTAAALAATVAGLGVAIPCLFGYNWLNTRIKSIAANNRVFLDEFVARLAEQYS